jgi:hypothetical protein
MWKSLPPDQRRAWEDKARAAKEAHERAYPNYRCVSSVSWRETRLHFSMSAHRYKPSSSLANADDHDHLDDGHIRRPAPAAPRKKRKQATGNGRPSTSRARAKGGAVDDEDTAKEKRRCEVVARVLMEAAASGMKDEGAEVLKERIGREMRKASMDAKVKRELEVRGRLFCLRKSS